MTHKKLWLPIPGLAIFFVVVVTASYFFLTAFDPHIPRNEAEWGPKKVDPKKNFFIKLIEKQLKSPKK